MLQILVATIAFRMCQPSTFADSAFLFKISEGVKKCTFMKESVHFSVVQLVLDDDARIHVCEAAQNIARITPHRCLRYTSNKHNSMEFPDASTD